MGKQDCPGEGIKSGRNFQQLFLFTFSIEELGGNLWSALSF